MIITLTLNPALDHELRVPAIKLNDVLRASTSRFDAGGKGFNVSRMLMALGEPSRAIAVAGGGAGQRLQQMLTALGIVTDFVPVCGETRTNVSVVDDASGEHLKVNEAGPNIDIDTQMALLDKVSALVKPDDWWVLAGSLPPGMSTDTYATLTRMILCGGARVLVDGSGKSLQQALRAKPNLIKPNLAEFQTLTGDTARTPEEIKRAVHKLGMPTCAVVVSLGRAGAVLCEGGRAWQLRAPVVVEQNPTGAGDAMVGGLLYGLNKGQTLLDAMPLALACGAAAASLPGTEMGTREMVMALVGQVTWEEV